MILLHALARAAVRLAGYVDPSQGNWWWADLIYVQQESGKSGLLRALSCLMSAPVLVFFRLTDRLWGSNTGMVLDAGLAAALLLSPLDIDIPPGLRAAVVGGCLGGGLVALMTGLRVGLRMGLIAGLIATVIAGTLSGVSGLDAGVSMGLGSLDTALAYVLVLSVVLRLAVGVHLRSMKRA